MQSILGVQFKMSYLHYNQLRTSSKGANGDKVKAVQSKFENNWISEIGKLETPKGVIDNAPVDVSYRSLER